MAGGLSAPRLKGSTSAGLPGFKVYDFREPEPPAFPVMKLTPKFTNVPTVWEPRPVSGGAEMEGGAFEEEIYIPDRPKERGFEPTVTAERYAAIPWRESYTEEDMPIEMTAAVQDAYYGVLRRVIPIEEQPGLERVSLEDQILRSMQIIKQEDIVAQAEREEFMREYEAEEAKEAALQEAIVFSEGMYKY